MKKPITIVFVSLYILVSVGITLSVHFCGDYVTSVQLVPFASSDDRCGCGHTENPDDCCKNEIKSIQLPADQLSVETKLLTLQQTGIPIWFENPDAPIYVSQSVQHVLPADSPPGSTPAYILHSSLLI